MVAYNASFPTTFNISHTINTPMDRNNYLSWRSQFFDILEIHGLEDVVTTNTKPPKKLDDGSLNPNYSEDKLVLSWIKSTCSPYIRSVLLPCAYAFDAWSLLEKRLSPVSKTYIRTLREQLRTLKNDSKKSMSDYLLHAKSLADSLTAASSVISDEELIESFLDGLGPEYKEFTIAVHLRSSLSYDDCYDLLLQEEHLIKKMSTLSLSSSAVFAASRRRAGSSNSAHNGHRSFSSPHSFGQGNGRGRHWRSSNQNRQANWNPPRPNPSPLHDTRPHLLPTPSLPPKPPTFEYDGYC
ncbi:hypothetical protein COP1_008862 [Malus domestica]